MRKTLNDCIDKGELKMKTWFAAILISSAMLSCTNAAQEKTASDWEFEGWFLIDNSSYEKALEAFSHAISIQQENDSFWLDKAFVLMLLDRQNESLATYNIALDLIEKKLEKNPLNTLALQEKSVALSGLGRQDEAGQAAEMAIRLYDLEIESNPANSTAWWYKGENLANLQRFEQALQAYEKVIEQNDSMRLKEAWLTKATLLRQLGRYDESILAFEEAIKIISSIDAKSLSDAWMWKGSTLEESASLGQCDQTEKLKEAYQAFCMSSELDSTNLWAWIGMGRTAEALDLSEKAAEAFDNATKQDINNIETWISKANSLFHNRKYNESILAYESVIDISGEDESTLVEAWLGKGDALNETGRESEALAAYEIALQIDNASLKENTMDASAWLNKGDALWRLKRYEAALQAYDAAIENAPPYWSTFGGSALLGKGNALLKIARYEDALEAFNQSIDYAPLNHRAWHGKAETLQALGRYDEASFALSLAGILGYRDQDAAKLKAIDKSETTIEGLAERLLASAYIGEDKLVDSKLLDGSLPVDMPVDMPIPDSSRVIGSLVQGKKGFYVVLDSELDPEQALQFYRESMSTKGWTEIEDPGESRGFSPDVKKLILCQGKKNAYLAISAYPLENGSDLRLNIYADPDYSPCRMRDGYDDWLRPLPKLIAPSGSEQEFQGFSSSGGNSVGTSAILKMDMNNTALLTHYRKQLQENNWTMLFEGNNSSMAWSIWTFSDEDDLIWRGVLWALDLPGTGGEHFVGIEAVVQEEENSSETKMVWAVAGSGPIATIKMENESESNHSEKEGQ